MSIDPGPALPYETPPSAAEPRRIDLFALVAAFDAPLIVWMFYMFGGSGALYFFFPLLILISLICPLVAFVTGIYALISALSRRKKLQTIIAALAIFTSIAWSACRYAFFASLPPMP